MYFTRKYHTHASNALQHTPNDKCEKWNETKRNERQWQHRCAYTHSFAHIYIYINHIYIRFTLYVECSSHTYTHTNSLLFLFMQYYYHHRHYIIFFQIEKEEKKIWFNMYSFLLNGVRATEIPFRLQSNSFSKRSPIRRMHEIRQKSPENNAKRNWKQILTTFFPWNRHNVAI